jgi:prepilin-type N-terminal cleavage/methylation domain-containing protein
MMWAGRNKRGFTLVEVISASVILCGAVMIVGTIGTQALIGTRLNRRYEMAASLIDRQLTLIDYVGIDSFIESGQTEDAALIHSSNRDRRRMTLKILGICITGKFRPNTRRLTVCI